MRSVTRHPDGLSGYGLPDLLHTLTRLAKRGWVLANRMNPSTKRLLATTVGMIGAGKAIVRTTEYRYLRWWSVPETPIAIPIGKPIARLKFWSRRRMAGGSSKTSAHRKDQHAAS